MEEEGIIETTLKVVMKKEPKMRIDENTRMLVEDGEIDRVTGYFELDMEDIAMKRSAYIQKHRLDPDKIRVKMPKGTIYGIEII